MILDICARAQGTLKKNVSVYQPGKVSLSSAFVIIDANPDRSVLRTWISESWLPHTAGPA